MTTPDRPLVLITEHLDDVPADWLAERGDVRRVSFDAPEFEELLPEASALVVRTYTQVNEELLSKAPNLKAVGRAGIALENIDLHACAARGITVVHTPAANTQAVVELVHSFIFDALRPRLFLDTSLDMDQWRSIRKELVAPAQYADLTIGIVGFGRIGTRIAQVAGAFGPKAVFNDIRAISENSRFGAEPLELDELLQTADIITVHVDDRPSNHGFLGADQFALMKDHVLFINTSRGFALDPAALAAWLSEHPEARAVLDVHEPEPIPEGDALLAAKNCWQTPHIGAATKTAHRNMSWVVRDVWAVLTGKTPEHPAAPKE